MSSSFTRTLRSLDAPSPKTPWLLAGLLLVAGWGWWLCSSRLHVYASSSRARIEVSRMVHRVAAEEGGRVVLHRIQLGRQVKKGDVLVALDDSVQRARLTQELAELASFRKRMRAVEHQIEAARAVRESRSQVGQFSAKQAVMRVERSRSEAQFKERLNDIAVSLHQREINSRVDAMHAQEELVSSRLRVRDAEIEASRVDAARDFADKSELAQLAQLSRELAELEAAIIVSEAEIEAIKIGIKRREIATPAGGELGSVASLHEGDVIEPGDIIATVIPRGDVRIVAEFDPDDVAGRIVPGQSARMRLTGVSWVEFGLLEATVSSVAVEPRDGTNRVELALAQEKLAIPVQHGLTGSVDIRVEELAPWALLARAIGARVLDGSLAVRPQYASLPRD